MAVINVIRFCGLSLTVLGLPWQIYVTCVLSWLPAPNTWRETTICCVRFRHVSPLIEGNRNCCLGTVMFTSDLGRWHYNSIFHLWIIIYKQNVTLILHFSCTNFNVHHISEQYSFYKCILYIYIQGVPGECYRLRENVPYVKVHGCNPKHLRICTVERLRR